MEFGSSFILCQDLTEEETISEEEFRKPLILHKYVHSDYNTYKNTTGSLIGHVEWTRGPVLMASLSLVALLVYTLSQVLFRRAMKILLHVT